MGLDELPARNGGLKVRLKSVAAKLLLASATSPPEVTMLTYEIAAMLCVATFTLGVGMGVFAVDMMRRAQSLPMREPIEHVEDDANWPRTIVNAEKGFKVLDDPADFIGYMTPNSPKPELPVWWKGRG
jgi:hypothetical protein